MKAVRDVLHTTFSVDANSCEIGFGPEPKPSCGERYWAIHQIRHAGLNQDWDLGEEYTVGVTLTMRMGFAPQDRWGIAVWLADSGLEELVRQTIVAIHHNQLLRQQASRYAGSPRTDLIVTPLQLMPQGIENPVPRGPEWFSSPPPETEHQTAECGVSQTVVFGKCQRVQDVPEME